jgi:hypothetical protein
LAFTKRQPPSPIGGEPKGSLHRRRRILASINKKGAGQMTISKCFTFMGTALLVLLFACHAYFYQAYFQEGVTLATERRLADEVSPAARIRETFALFVPGDAKRMRDTARLLARAVRPQA